MPVHRPIRTLATAALALALATGALSGCATSAPANLVGTADPEPTSTAPEPLLTDGPAPDTATGTLAPGFPSALVPVPAGAEILVSSAAPQPNGTVQISLNLRTSQDTAGLLEAIRAPLLAAGFTDSPPAQPDPSLAAQASFVRSNGAEFVLVGILDRDGQRTLTLGGTVRP